MRIILFLIIFVVHCYAKHTPKGVSIDSDAGVVSVDDYLLNCVESGNTLEEVQEVRMKRAKRRNRGRKPRKSSSAPSSSGLSELSSHAGRACVPKSMWSSLIPSSFTKEAIQILVDSGMGLANNAKVVGDSPKWAPDKKTGALITSKGGDESMDEKCKDIYIWTGNFPPPCTGAELPAIRTRGVIPMSAKAVAELLMDSNRVKVYNKMSLGRTDVTLFQSGIRTKSKEWGEGETKIVKNKTKPPMISKTMVFTTLMHARKMSDSSYVVVSRAVSDGEGDVEEGNTIKSEIMLGVNILRPLTESSCELSSVTHVNSPLVPSRMAKTVGVKGAVNFINDIRALGKNK